MTQTIIMSAPSKSGFSAEFATTAQAQQKAAELLGVDVDDMIEVESNGTTYCYASQSDADKDRDGAYAVKYTLEPVKHFIVRDENGKEITLRAVGNSIISAASEIYDGCDEGEPYNSNTTLRAALWQAGCETVQG